LKGAEVFERWAFGMAVGVARGDVEAVQDSGLLEKISGHFDRQLAEQPRDDVTPGVLSQGKVDGLDGLLGGLLGGEAGPLVALVAARRLGLLEIADGLFEPVGGTRGHIAPSRRFDGSLPPA
jgi:hypothetical protein